MCGYMYVCMFVFVYGYQIKLKQTKVCFEKSTKKINIIKIAEKMEKIYRSGAGDNKKKEMYCMLFVCVFVLDISSEICVV